MIQQKSIPTSLSDMIGLQQILLLMCSSIVFMLPEEYCPVRMELICAMVVIYFLNEWKNVVKSVGRKRAAFVLATDLRYNFIAILATMTIFSLMVFVYADPDRMEIAIRRPVLYRALQAHVASGAYAMCIFIALFSLVLNLCLSGLPTRISPQRVDQLSPVRLRWFFVILYFLTLAARVYAYASGRTNFTSDTNYGEIFGGLGSLVSLITSQSLYIPALLLVIGKLYKDTPSIIACVAMIVIEMIYGGVLGIKSAIILPIAFALYGSYYAWGKLPKLAILAPVLIVGAIFADIAYVSRVISVEDARAKGVELLVLATKEAATDLFSESKDSRAGRQDQGYWLSRMNVAIPLLASIEHVEAEGVTGDGSSYGNMLLSVVPSFVFPWKPDPFDVNLYGRSVGLISPYDFITAIRPSYLGDLYYSFGWFGIAIGPVLLALLLGGLVRLVERKRICLNFYTMAFFLSIFDAENSVGNSFGGLIKTFLILWLAFALADRKAPSTSSPVMSSGRFNPSR